jgi:hypothetical protein
MPTGCDTPSPAVPRPRRASSSAGYQKSMSKQPMNKDADTARIQPAARRPDSDSARTGWDRRAQSAADKTASSTDARDHDHQDDD